MGGWWVVWCGGGGLFSCCLGGSWARWHLPSVQPMGRAGEGAVGSSGVEGGLSFTCCWPKWTWGGELAVLWEWPMGCGQRD